MAAKDGQGNPITAESIASSMLGSIKARGGKTIAPFAAPDPAYQGQLSYYAISYYVYPRTATATSGSPKSSRMATAPLAYW